MFSKEFVVSYSDINREYKLSNKSILKMFQDIATLHAFELNDGLTKSNCGWFLLSYHIKVLDRPTYNQKLKVQTWSRKIKSVTASREFEVYGEDGKLKIVGISNWVRMNLETQKPERVSQELISAYGEEEKTNFDEIWLEKLSESENIGYSKSYVIERNFIDTNIHMNNVAYLEMALNVLPEKVFELGESNEFRIMYKKAIKYQDKVMCNYSEEEDCFKISFKVEDELCAIVELKK